jgi:quinol-cytochrome oxidoreductase complex cytochrome b subunit
MAHGNEFKPSGNAVIDWIEYRLPIFKLLDGAVGSYPAPRNLNYWWNFGSLAGLCLVAQILTGLFLAMHYTPEASKAFASVEHIMRDVNYGWLLRYMHAVGASLFFAVVYIHIFRGLYYGSYKTPRELLWWLGIIILFLMMATAFMGYVLPWGQMSFWGATVITNFFSAIPFVGNDVLVWLRGDYSVGNDTLNRFFALHFLLPFVIVGVVILHIWALHQHGSNNPLGIDVKTPQDTVPFNPYYTFKDLFGIGAFLLVFAYLVFFQPNLLGDADNYIPANPMSTPAEIVPEWYFLPFYAILRSVPDIGIPGYFVLMNAKLAGVICMAVSILVLFALPWLDSSKVRSARFRPMYKLAFWALLVDCVILGWIGGHQAVAPYIWIGRVATLYYFLHFFVLVPVIARKEKPLPLPTSIAASVLAEK